MFLPEHTAGVNASVSAGAYFTDDIIAEVVLVVTVLMALVLLVLILLVLVFLVVV